MQAVVCLKDKWEVVRQYELRLANVLKAAGLDCEPVFRAQDGYNPTTGHWKELLESGFPFVKTEVISNPSSNRDPGDCLELLSARGFDTRLAEWAAPTGSAPAAEPPEPDITPPPINPVAAGLPGAVTIRAAAALAEISWQPPAGQKPAALDKARAKYQAAKLSAIRTRDDDLLAELQGAMSAWAAGEAGGVSIDALIRAVGIVPTYEPSTELTKSLPTPILRRYRDAQITTSRRLRLDHRHIGASCGAVTISILMPVYKTPLIFLERALLSVVCQTYQDWELCVVDSGSGDAGVTAVLDYYEALDRRVRTVRIPDNAGISHATNIALEMASGSYIGLLDHDDMITSDTLETIADHLIKDPTVDLVYTDECKIDENDIVQYLMPKPDWSPLLLTAFMYTGHFSVYRTSLVRRLGGLRSEYDFSQDYDLVLRVAEMEPTVAHIRGYHYGWRMISGSAAVGDKPNARQSNIAALQDAINRRGWGGVAVALPMANRALRAVGEDAPLVSIVIPTGGKIELLSRCVSGIFENTIYENFEIIIVRNTDTNPEASPYLEALSANPRVLVVNTNEPYNFSQSCNQGAAAARGDFVIFYNDDVFVISPDWIQVMLECLTLPGVGIVGPKLLYQNEGIQHAGMVTGTRRLLGTAFHTYPRNTPANMNLAQSVREVSLLSGACLAMKKTVFDEVGGYDEINTPREHSDVDLCFRARELGYRCVYTPHADLTHLGHVTMGTEEAARKAHKKGKHDLFLLKRFGDYLADDPYFPPPMRDILYANSPEEFRLFPRYARSAAGDPTALDIAHSAAPDQSAALGAGAPALDILILSHDLSESGAPRAAYEVAGVLREAGHFVVVASPSDGPYRKRLCDIGVDVIVDEVLLNQDPNVFDFARDFDKVICNTIVCWPAVAQLHEAVDIYWYVHESEAIREFVDNVPGFAAVLEKGVPIWANSRLAAKFLIANGVEPRIIEYGIPERTLLRLKTDCDVSKFVIGVFGSYEPRKGQDLAISGMLKLPEKVRRQVELRLFGRTLDPSFRDHIEQHLAGGDSSVVFFTEVDHDECLRQMAVCDVILISSRDDALSFVGLDALALGKALICSRTTGISEYLEDGQSGLILHENTAEEIARVLARVIDDSDLREALGKGASEVYRINFSMPSFTKKLTDALGICKRHEETLSKLSAETNPTLTDTTTTMNNEDPRFWHEFSRNDLALRIADLLRQRRELAEKVGEVEVEAARRAIASAFLSGSGIEVGAGSRPVKLPENVTVRYGDVREGAELKEYFHTVEDLCLPESTLIDAQNFLGVAAASLDFVISGHVIEHLIDPVASIAHAMRVLKPGGRYMLIVPDMAHTWDRDRPETTVEHVLADYRDGGVGTLKQAYWEHLSFVHPIHSGERLPPEEIEARIVKDVEARPDIHFHAWTGVGFRQMLNALSSKLGFKLLCEVFNVNENIFVLERQ